MKPMMLAALCAATGLALAGCGEVSQSKSADTVNRGDQPAYKGAANAQVAKNWKPGDRTAWENQVRQRGQYQNEYVKTN